MQDLAALEKSLMGIATALKSGGWALVAFFGVFVIYKIGMVLAKRQHKAGQEVNVNLPSGATAGAALCPLHSGIEAQVESLERSAEAYRKENSQQHAKIFDGLKEVAVNVAGLTAQVGNVERRINNIGGLFAMTGDPKI